MNKLAEFPLERAGLGDAPDNTIIVAWPGWNLTVGDVRKAKADRPYSTPTPLEINCRKYGTGSGMCGCGVGHCAIDRHGKGE